MSARETHGWCSECQEESAIDAEARCLWCGGPTQASGRKRGKPRGKYGFLSDAKLKALHQFHTDRGYSLRELGRRVWASAGYSSAKSAANSISYGWKRLGLAALDTAEATRRSNFARRAPDSPGTADRSAYRRYLRVKHGKRRPCKGSKLTYPEKGRPCERWALADSDYCVAHDPGRREWLLAHLVEAREKAIA